MQNAGTALAIGGRPGCCEYFVGAMDDVGFYRSAFSEADIARIAEKGLAQGGLSTPVSPEGNLTVAWGALKVVE